MTEESKAMQLQEQEIVQSNGTERMRARATFLPRADIYETEDHVVVTVICPVPAKIRLMSRWKRIYSQSQLIRPTGAQMATPWHLPNSMLAITNAASG